MLLAGVVFDFIFGKLSRRIRVGALGIAVVLLYWSYMQFLSVALLYFAFVRPAAVLTLLFSLGFFFVSQPICRRAGNVQGALFGVKMADDVGL